MKRVLSFMLAVIMSFALLPSAVFADTPTGEISPEEIIAMADTEAEQSTEEMPTMIPGSKWEGKNILFIGDQLVADKIYPEYVGAMLGANVHYHCLSSANIVTLIKGTGKSKTKYTGKNELAPLSVFDVKYMDLVIIHCGYNNRGTALGKLGEQYDEKKKSQRSQNSISGSMHYAISKTRQLLKLVRNIQCPILVVTVDCVGKSPSINATGCDEYPSGSGHTLEDVAKMQMAVADRTAVKYCDLYHNSGINPDTWNIYSKSSDPVNTKYSPYELDADGKPVSDKYLKYKSGESYYQIRDGKAVLEKYSSGTPYPYNTDQVRKNKAGYMNIAETVVSSIRLNFGI